QTKKKKNQSKNWQSTDTNLASRMSILGRLSNATAVVMATILLIINIGCHHRRVDIVEAVEFSLIDSFQIQLIIRCQICWLIGEQRIKIFQIVINFLVITVSAAAGAAI